jgi:hypothetical protein
MDLIRRTPAYCPILRAKQGEIQALGALSPRAKSRIRPLVDVQKQKSGDTKNLFEYLCGTVRSLVPTWGTGRPVYLDMSLFPPEMRVAETHPVQTVFDIARQAGIIGVPVTGSLEIRGPAPDYLDAVAAIAKRDGRGVALRLEHNDIRHPDTLRRVIEETRGHLGLERGECDIFLDLEAIDRLPANMREIDSLFQIVLAALQALSDDRYRMIVLCGTSIPERVGKEYDAAPCQVDRLEFNVWKAIAAVENIHTPVFGDYGIVYPFQITDDIPIRAPSRIRLSTFGKHHLYRSTPDDYLGLRRRVTKEPPALSQVECIGTRAIFGRGHGFTQVGNATDWITRDMNAHLETTLSHIARVNRRTIADVKSISSEVSGRQPWLQDPLVLETENDEQKH